MNKAMVLVIHERGADKLGETKKNIVDGLIEAAKDFALSSFYINDKVELE